jgi:hypothetical protein
VRNGVSRIKHAAPQSSIVGWYNGSKESEKTVVAEYFKSYEALSGKYTLDALHLSDDLVDMISQKGVLI